MRNNDLRSGQVTSPLGTGKLPRRLDERFKTSLVLQLSSLSHVEKVRIYSAPDSECRLFAQQIKEYLDTVGWITDEVQSLNQVHHSGMVIQLNSDDQSIAEIIIGRNH